MPTSTTTPARRRNLFVRILDVDIAPARKTDEQNPVAKALRRMGQRSPSVGYDTFTFTADKKTYRGDLTKKAQTFLDAFFSKGKTGVGPVTFRLRAAQV